MGKLIDRRQRSRSPRVIRLGFIKDGEQKVLDASDPSLKTIPLIETSQKHHSVSISFVGGYIEDLPDVRKENEMFLSIKSETLSEAGTPEQVAFAFEASVRDRTELSGMSNRMVFRNLKIRKELNLEIHLL